MLASYLSAYPVVGKAEAKRTVPAFALYLVIVENQLAQNVPEFLLVLILLILIITANTSDSRDSWKKHWF